jgi:hypothetical protein
MPKLISSTKEIGFTILPYLLDTPIIQELLAHPSDYALGFITHDKETGERKFTYIESGILVEAKNHWSLTILKESPYCEEEGSWIVYTCSHGKTQLEFNKILKNSGETLHLNEWDTWCVEGKDSKVIVITSWEIF